MKIEEVINKDAAVQWLKGKIDEGWTPAQVREMATLTTGIPIECRTLLYRILDRMEKFELESWAHRRKIRCEACGYREVMTAKLAFGDGHGVWIPGMKCPKCSSEKFYPVVEITRQSIFLRYWKGNPAVALALIVVLFTSLFVAIHSAFPKRKYEEKVVFVCLECGKYFVDEVSFYPVECQYCTKRKAMMAIQCEKCGHVYVWIKTNWEKQPPVCPECGSKESTLLSKRPR